MNILVTGAKGFVGRNLVENLRNLRDGKDRTRPNLRIDRIFEYDIDGTPAQLEGFCREADFVFNLAGVNRPKDPKDFEKGNFGFASALLDTLIRQGNKCPVMLSSSIQASLVGRYDNEYGRSKKAGEELFFRYARETGARVFVYRFPNLFGKWCRPNYNSVVATFCNNIARGLPISVSDRDAKIELLHVDDLVDEMFDALEGREHRCDFDGTKVLPSDDGSYCYVPAAHQTTLGAIVDMLESFKALPRTLLMPKIPEGSLAKKLYATYLSYLPEDEVAFPLRMNIDARGSFTELLKSEQCGQVSVNIAKPGVTKGEHWHNSKWELFVVVSGRALIRERRIGSDELLEFEVSGDRIEAVHMLPGWTHSITNLSETEDLVTVMWASERFDRDHPDTFHQKVD